MPFTGKATYDAPNLAEIAEDVSDILGIVSPYETPLLNHLGDAPRAANSTIHEWLEDSLLPNFDHINDDTYSDASIKLLAKFPVVTLEKCQGWRPQCLSSSSARERNGKLLLTSGNVCLEHR